MTYILTWGCVNAYLLCKSQIKQRLFWFYLSLSRVCCNQFTRPKGTAVSKCFASCECSSHAILIGNYAKELEEDYTVYDAISEVQGILGANEVKCNALKAQYSKYGYLWKRDLNETLKVNAVACIVLGATRAFVICAMTCTSLPL